MADTPVPSKNFLTSKLGPAPVYVWAGGALGAALLYSRLRGAKQQAAAQQPTSTAANEPSGTVPQFIIENQLPAYGAPSAPISPPSAAPPAVVPPGSSTTPPYAGGHPPVGASGTSFVAPPGTSPTPSGPTQLPASWYKVVAGDSLGSIAARNGTTAEKIYQYNTTPGNRSAESIATIRQRGPNLIYAGESLLIPPR